MKKKKYAASVAVTVIIDVPFELEAGRKPDLEAEAVVRRGGVDLKMGYIIDIEVENVEELDG